MSRYNGYNKVTITGENNFRNTTEKYNSKKMLNENRVRLYCIRFIQVFLKYFRVTRIICTLWTSRTPINVSTFHRYPWAAKTSPFPERAARIWRKSVLTARDAGYQSAGDTRRRASRYSALPPRRTGFSVAAGANACRLPGSSTTLSPSQ